MSKLVWDQVGERLYRTGVDHGVIYPMGTNGKYGKGVAWNGLTAVNENPSGADANAQYADNIKYLNLVSAEDFGFTIEAFTYPDEFAICDGSASAVDGVMLTQQPRKVFGFAYRTLIGNDVDSQDHGYELHLCYNCLAAPSSKNNATVNESPAAVALSWEVKTTPVEVTASGGKYKPTAHIIINSNKADADKLAALEDKLYGTNGDDATEPTFLTPDEVITLMTAAAG